MISLVASGNGLTPTTSAQVNPRLLDFGPVIVGSTVLQQVTLFNTGNTLLTVNSGFVVGAGFGVDLSGLPALVPVNSYKTFTVSFTPASSNPSGTFTSGTLTFNTAAPDPQPSVSLKGVGAFASAHTATLTWTPGNASIVGYNVYRSTVSGFGFQKLNSGLLVAPGFTDSNLAAGQTYYWVVTAVNAVGGESVFSKQISATVSAP